jgi:hypothetical protein
MNRQTSVRLSVLIISLFWFRLGSAKNWKQNTHLTCQNRTYSNHHKTETN